MLIIIVLEMLATNISNIFVFFLLLENGDDANNYDFLNYSNYHFQKYWRQMLAIIVARSAGNKWYQLEHPEMMASNVSNYTFQRCWRYMLSILIFRNGGNKY